MWSATPPAPGEAGPLLLVMLLLGECLPRLSESILNTGGCSCASRHFSKGIEGQHWCDV